MNRSLRQIPDNANVMVDANVLVYALTPQTHLHQQCRDLLDRARRGNLKMYTSVSIAADVLHRAMVLEVLAQGQAKLSAEAVRLLKQNPNLVTGLAHYRNILRDMQQAGIDILPLTYRDLHTSRVYREQHGLLTNDSLIVAVMQRERIQFLATNDSDFDGIPGIVTHRPIP